MDLVKKIAIGLGLVATVGVGGVVLDDTNQEPIIDTATSTPALKTNEQTREQKLTREEKLTITRQQLAAGTVTIREAIVDLDAKDRATVKGEEIAKAVQKEKVTRGAVEIEIVDIEPIEGGVQVFARAWKNGQQIGFGKDGTVDIERFRIFNPPVLVDDPNGDVVREWVDEDTQELRTRTFRENPKQAIVAVLENIVANKSIGKGQIERGKIGNTTTVIYPNYDGEGGATTFDGTAGYTVAGTFSDCRDATTSNIELNDNGTALRAMVGRRGAANGFAIWRVFLLFDTTPIGADTITGVTFSGYVYGKVDSENDSASFINIVRTAPASDTAIAAGDYDAIYPLPVTAGVEMTQGATAHDITSIATGAYKDWVLDATGLTWVDGSGITKLGLAEGHDILDEDSNMTGSNTNNSGIYVYAVDQTGTTQDPYLTIEHEAGGGTPDTGTFILFN